MALNSQKRTFYCDMLDKAKERLQKLYDDFDVLIANTTTEYQFDSGEGKQSAKKRSVTDIEKQIQILESRILWLMGKLEIGGGLTSINLRRKNSYIVGRK